MATTAKIGGRRVLVDGIEVKGVKTVIYAASYDNADIATIEIIAKNVICDDEAIRITTYGS